MTALEKPNSTPAVSSFATRLTGFLSRQWGVLVAFGLLVLFPFLYALFSGQAVDAGPARFWQGQLIAFFIMAVYAMSYDLLLGYTGILSFGHAAFFGAGAYTMALFIDNVLPAVTSRYRVMVGAVNITEPGLFLVAILLVLLVAGLVGLLFSALSMRVRGVYYAMISLAIAEAFFILSKATDFVKWTGADEGLHGIPVPAWINPTQYRLRFYYLALIFLIVMFIVLRRVVKSPTGHVFIALRENESRVRMIGYNPSTYRAIAFVTAAISAGLAGSIYSLWNLGATPSMMGAGTTINALIMVILGGIGTLTGPILGAGLMQILQQFLYQWFGQRWPLVFGLIFIALVVFMPYGIVGTYNLRRAQMRGGWKRLLGRFQSKNE